MKRNRVLALCVSPGRLDFEVVKHLRVEEREDDHLLQSCDVTRQTSDAVKPHLRKRTGREKRHEGAKRGRKMQHCD